MIQQSAFRYAVILVALIIIVVFLSGLLFYYNPDSEKAGLPAPGTQILGKPEGSQIIPPTTHAVNPDNASQEYDGMIPDTPARENLANPAPSLTGTVTSTTPALEITPTATSTPVLEVTYTTPVPVPTPTEDPVTPVPTSVSPSAEINLYGQLIIPRSLTVSRGTTVVWKNNDFIPRSVISGTGSPVSFNSGRINPGELYTFTFTEEGTYPFVSGAPKTYHGTITVI